MRIQKKKQAYFFGILISSVKQLSNNVKKVLMKKTLEYFYIFSKLSTSFILLFSLLILGYFFYISFRNQGVSSDDQANLINKLSQNEKKLSNLFNKIEITDASLDEIQKSIKNITNVDNSEELRLLNQKIEKLYLSFENLSVNLKEIETKNVTETNKALNDNISSEVIDKNKLEIAKLVIYKFENNLDYSDELNILQNFNDNNTQHIFEKINLVKLKNYRGNTFLKNIYSQELDLYLKERFNKNYNNFISKSLMNFVAIQPSKKNIIKNNEINLLNEIGALINEKNYKMSYTKIINIDNYEKFFLETTNQIQIVNEFKDLINKVH